MRINRAGNRLGADRTCSRSLQEWMEDVQKRSQVDKVRRWARGCVGKAWPVNGWARVCEVGLSSNDLEVMMDGGRWAEKRPSTGSGPKEHKLEKDDQDLPAVEWLRVHASCARMQVWSLVKKLDPICCVMWPKKRKRSSTWFVWKGTSDSREQSNLIKVRRLRDQDSGKSTVQTPVSSLLSSSSYNDWFFSPHIYFQQKSTWEDRTTKAKCKEKLDYRNKLQARKFTSANKRNSWLKPPGNQSFFVR